MESQDQELIRLVAHGDESALQTTMERYSARMYVIARRVLGEYGTNEDIEEILIDSFLRAWETSDSYDPSKASVSTWIGWIVIYQSLTKRRKLKKFAREMNIISYETSETQELSVERKASDNVRIGELFKTLENMKTQDKEIIVRRYINDESAVDIARSLGVSPVLIRVRIHRALRELRKLMLEVSS